jgi:SAM-dependent methyltransferase
MERNSMTQYSERADTGPDIKRKLYRKYCANAGKIADLGCSLGLLIRHDPKHCIGVDRDRDAVRLARQTGAAVVLADFAVDGVPFLDRAFDLVNLDNVIEHLPKRSGELLLRECARILRPGGRLLVRTPDVRRCAKKFRSDPEHVCPYDAATLDETIRSCGLEILSMGHWAFNYLKWVPLLNRWYAVSDRLEGLIAAVVSDNWFAVARKV